VKELIEIQKELKAPKGQYNSFGKYKYRSAEDILEAVKPLLHKNKCQLTLSDEIELIGDRYYVKATAKITNGEEAFWTSAYAREDLEKKGMDGAQITGTASSYARKYALNGLFCIDDTKDADTDEYANQQKQEEKPSKKKTTSAKKTSSRDELVAYCESNGIDMKQVASFYDLSREATEEQFANALKELKASEVR
jgi:predicted acyl esterase